MRDPLGFAPRILNGAALRNEGVVTPSQPRFIKSPVAGYSDAASIIVDGPPLEGQVTEDRFLVMVAEAALFKLGLAKHGDEGVQEAAERLGEVALRMYRSASSRYGASWNDIVERLIGPVDRRTGDTARSVAERLIEVVDAASYLELVNQVAAAQAQAPQVATTEEFDPDEFWAVLLPIAGKLVDPTVMAAAEEIEKNNPSNEKSSFADGQIVHRFIQTYYARNNPGLVMIDRDLWGANGFRWGTVGELTKSSGAAWPIVGLLDQAFTTVGRQGFLGAAKPDILDPDRAALYEIKPRRRARLGVLQMAVYTLWYNGLLVGELASNYKPLMPGGRMAGSGVDLFNAPEVAPATVERFARVSQDARVPGLIFYDIYGCKDCTDVQEAIRAYTGEEAPDIGFLMALLLAGIIVEGILIVTPAPGDEVAFGGVLAQIIRMLLRRPRPGQLALLPAGS